MNRPRRRARININARRPASVSPQDVTRLVDVISFVNLNRPGAAAVGVTSKTMAKSMLPPNFTKDSQVQAILETMKTIKNMSWWSVLNTLLIFNPFELPNKSPGLGSLKHSRAKLKKKLQAYVEDPTMSFEGFLNSLTVSQLGAVQQVIERGSIFARSNTQGWGPIAGLGPKMEFGRL